MSVGSVSHVNQASSLVPATRFQWLQALKAVDMRIVALAVGLVCVVALAIRWWRGSAQPAAITPAPTIAQASGPSVSPASTAPSASVLPIASLAVSSPTSSKGMTLDEVFAAIKKALEVSLNDVLKTDEEAGLTQPDEATCAITVFNRLTSEKMSDSAIRTYEAQVFNDIKKFSAKGSVSLYSNSWTEFKKKLPQWLQQFAGQKVGFMALAMPGRGGDTTRLKAKAVICDFSSTPTKPLPSSAATASAATTVSSKPVAAASVDTSRNGKIQAAIEVIRKAADKSTAGGWEGATVTVKNNQGLLIEGDVANGHRSNEVNESYEVNGFRYANARKDVQNYTFYTEVLRKKLQELSPGTHELWVFCEPERSGPVIPKWIAVTVNL